MNEDVRHLSGAAVLAKLCPVCSGIMKDKQGVVLQFDFRWVLRTALFLNENNVCGNNPEKCVQTQVPLLQTIAFSYGFSVQLLCLF